jgi:hypothetical protein
MAGLCSNKGKPESVKNTLKRRVIENYGLKSVTNWYQVTTDLSPWLPEAI